MKFRITIIVIVILAIGVISFLLLENRELNKWDIASKTGMYTVAIVYHGLDSYTRMEIQKDIYELYHFEKAGEGLDNYDQNWRNSGYIRFHFVFTESMDLATISSKLKKDFKNIFSRHRVKAGWKLCILDDNGNKY